MSVQLSWRIGPLITMYSLSLSLAILFALESASPVNFVPLKLGLELPQKAVAWGSHEGSAPGHPRLGLLGIAKKQVLGSSVIS